ncbi:NADPH-dependent FMN reductase [Aerococcaceae bacterium 50-4]
MKRIVGIVGTNSKKSTNRRLLKFIQKHFADQAEIELLEIRDFPIFNKPEDKTLPSIVEEAGEKIEQADAVIISAAEYNHSITSSLTNALHWLSYFIYPLADKPIMITGASNGRLGSSRAQMHLRQILDSPDIRARVMPNSEFLLGHSLQAFDDDGDLSDPKSVERLDTIFDEFIHFIDHTQEFTQLRNETKEAAENYEWRN